MSILVTGGLGFIGLNFIKEILRQNFNIINLDLQTYAANINYINELKELKNLILLKGNICDLTLLEKIFKENNIQGVIHFAAETHVDNSISGPSAFIETNITGTFNLLEAARTHWMNSPFNYKDGYENRRFLHISTDEVYGSLGESGYFTEESSYAPNSPYSASKASSDMLVRSYHHTYGLNTIITNCSNNFGPYQHDEKLIPTVIRAALNLQLIPVYGDGSNVRDWLYVGDHCNALKVIFEEAKPGSHYNIGGNNEKSNLEIVEIICNLLDILIPSSKLTSYKELITFVKDRPGHDQRYAIDASKLKRELGWKPSDNFEVNLMKTIRWYINKYGFTPVC
ncbi:dTDP-glucose 4,6-dehydratase [Bacillus sp. 31A1R]|uniref:dTDP-glucose 4,6-dehydratase n=1 Tax=Robertmurraya mangrovi TaxID=3098077 RepID=A0ABU5IXW9_9BACI|nr:dTDP-glucose 4,6-dehydratase [Bacillus sp. 31A1R]MDZ5471972.1 dTDP-glucose 4,6-dehydratase [Bacillus sp. 31A1R]